MNGNQGIHRLAPWNKQTRTATQIKKKHKTQKKNSNSPTFFIGKPYINVPFSMAMLNSQRVITITCSI